MQYSDLNQKKSELDSLLPFSPEVAEKLRKEVELELAFVGGVLDGSTMTRKDTSAILNEDKTVESQSLTEHIKVLNSAKAFDLISVLAKKTQHQVDDSDVKEIHRVIVRNLDDKGAGFYRSQPKKFEIGDYEMPDFLRVQRGMSDFGMWLFAATTLHPVVLAAEAHLRLMTLNPFNQGSAATARFVMNLILLLNGYPPALFARREKKEYWESLELAIFKNNREPYEKLIHRAVYRALELYTKQSVARSSEVLDKEPYYLRIGQLAKESGERVSTLRYWTGLGLLDTTGKTSAGYTLYSSEILPKIQQLKSFKEQRFTLDEIRQKLQE